MRKIFFLVALLSASIMSFAAGEVNFALASEGSSASASSGDAALAIDGNNGTRWESAQTDAEWYLPDLGQSRTFNQVNILLEGAYASAPAAAAPAPTWPAAQVKAIYSPTYEANCGFGEWGSGTAVEDTEFGKKYTVPASGYFGMVDFAINATAL